MSKYVTQVLHLDNGNSFEYVNYMNAGTWFTYGKNIQNEGWKYKENEKLWKVLSSLVHSGRRVRMENTIEYKFYTEFISFYLT